MAQKSTKLPATMHPLVLTGNTLVQKSGDAAAPFLQDAAFYWLTSLDEPNWQYVYDGREVYLIAPEVSEVQALFEGSTSYDEAMQLSGVDYVISKNEGDALIKNLSQQHDYVWTLGPDPHEKYYDFAMNPAQGRLRAELGALFKEVKDARPELDKLRAIKRADEIQEIQSAIDLTMKSFETVKLNLQSFTHEYQIEAEFNKAFRETGASGHAYEPIVAGGKNACTLHYCKNNDALPKGGLVLLDIGARVNGYAADVTRTYAVGTPTARQKAVHAEVEKAHFAIIELIKPGVSLKEYSDAVDAIMKSALKSLDLLKEESDYRKYFPHAISHSLGIDVHDTLGGYKEFMPGMVLTVEPGIYIPEEGIGIRIEDDILVTDDGHKNLSGALSTSL